MFGGDAMGIMLTWDQIQIGVLLCVALLALGGLMMWWGRSR